jgi:hypothetical protein
MITEDQLEQLAIQWFQDTGGENIDPSSPVGYAGTRHRTLNIERRREEKRSLAEEVAKSEHTVCRPFRACNSMDDGTQDVAMGYAYRGQAYRRVGNTSQQLSREEYNRILLERLHGDQRWENQTAEGWSLDDLDGVEITRTVEESIRRGRVDDPGTRDPAEVLRGLGLMKGGSMAFVMNEAALFPPYSALLRQFTRQSEGIPQLATNLATKCRERQPDVWANGVERQTRIRHSGLISSLNANVADWWLHSQNAYNQKDPSLNAKRANPCFPEN